MVSITPTTGVPPPDLSIVTRLLHCVVSTEAPRNKSGPPQCHRCQKLGHKQEFCEKTPRCNSCGGFHFGYLCKVDKNEVPTKCANCDGPHPANHKGCPYQRQYRDNSRKPGTSSTQIPISQSHVYTRQRSTPRIRIDFPVLAPATQRPPGSTFLPSYAGAVTNSNANASTTDSQSQPPVEVEATTSSLNPPRETSSTSLMDWQPIILSIVNTVIECDIHPLITMIAKLIPSLMQNSTIMKATTTLIEKFAQNAAK